MVTYVLIFKGKGRQTNPAVSDPKGLLTFHMILPQSSRMNSLQTISSFLWKYYSLLIHMDVHAPSWVRYWALSLYPASADGAQPELFIFNELCALKDNPGPCKAMKDRYFFSVDTGRCELFEYGGCRGNRNNFETLEECEETCVVSGESI